MRYFNWVLGDLSWAVIFARRRGARCVKPPTHVTPHEARRICRYAGRLIEYGITGAGGKRTDARKPLGYQSRRAAEIPARGVAPVQGREFSVTNQRSWGLARTGRAGHAFNEAIPGEQLRPAPLCGAASVLRSPQPLL